VVSGEPIKYICHRFCFNGKEVVADSTANAAMLVAHKLINLVKNGKSIPLFFAVIVITKLSEPRTKWKANAGSISPEFTSPHLQVPGQLANPF